MNYKKKLIEVALPLEEINKASVLEKQPFTRKHPRSIHIWWARRPLVAARAVIFSQMVDDPSSNPDLFPTEKAQEKERKRLFKIIEDLVQWENTANEAVLNRAREEIWQSWRRACAQNADHPYAKELFDRKKLPAFHDPFSGGGALPLEAQRLGLESYASDLNPVAVLINKALIEIPPKFAGKPPVNPDALKDKTLFKKTWNGSEGLAGDVHYYGQWMSDEAEKRIGYLYPKVKITKEIVKERPDLKLYEGEEINTIAWLWARTVKSPNPGFSKVDVPLVSTYFLATKEGKEAYIDPKIESTSYRFTVKVGKPKDMKGTKLGTSAGKRAAFRCLLSGVPISYDYIRQEGKAGRMGVRLMAIVAEGKRGRVYLSPTPEMEAIGFTARPTWKPDIALPVNPRDFKTPNYGLTTFADLFTSRQLVALTTFSDLVHEVQKRVKHDALAGSFPDDKNPLSAGGVGAVAYADAVATYLGIATSRWADLSNSMCSWNSTNQNVRALFARQAIPMNWDFVELSPFSKLGPWFATVESFIELAANLNAAPSGWAKQANASQQDISLNKVISTDPPYYDNIGYADLSDFFYVWLRQSLKQIIPDLFTTLVVPKAEELVATPYRHGSKEKAEGFFLDGMTQAMHRLAEQSHPAFPVTIYYAFKQSENESEGATSTGWETFLDAVIQAGFAITGTWPMRTEREARSIGLGSNALASSIILVCRQRVSKAGTITRREFLSGLKAELPAALAYLQRGNIAPVDLAQAAIGPGMAVFTRYAKVMESDGSAMTSRSALILINQMLDEVLVEQEGEFDADTRWALTWFEQKGMSNGAFGDADNLSRAKNTAVNGLVEAGIVASRAGQVRLLKREELLEDWDPAKDKRLTNWEAAQYLIRALEREGEAGAAQLLKKLGSHGEIARDLAYRLYNICERKKWANEALSYNALVIAWPEITKLVQGDPSRTNVAEKTLFDN